MSELKIISETPEWLVLCKPSGWLSIPGRGERLPILSEWLRESRGQIWVVHRLDVDTSGVMIFAKSADAHRRANRWFEKNEIRKEYHCIVQGRLGAPITRANRPIEGRSAVTQIEVLEKWSKPNPATLVRAVPRSGRRHQIRIHLAELGFPLWGDLTYGGPVNVTLPQEMKIERVALHSKKIELPTGECFECEWPADFLAWVEALRKASL